MKLTINALPVEILDNVASRLPYHDGALGRVVNFTRGPTAHLRPILEMQ